MCFPDRGTLIKKLYVRVLLYYRDDFERQLAQNLREILLLERSRNKKKMVQICSLIFIARVRNVLEYICFQTIRKVLLQDW